MFAASGAKDSQSLSSQSIGEKKGLGHVRLCCGCGQIDGFRDTAVAVPLEGGLHTHMLRRRYVMCRDEEPPDWFGNTRHMLNRGIGREIGPEFL